MITSKSQSENILIDSSSLIGSYRSESSVNRYRVNSINNKTSVNYYENNECETKNKKAKSKKVIIIDKPTIIEVECWKKYNSEQTSEDNIEDYIEGFLNNKDDDQTKNNNNKEDNKRKKNKSDTITCTCIII